MTYRLQIVEANHTDNQFYTLGTAEFETAVEREAKLATIPAFNHGCDADDRCYFLDILDPSDGFSVVDDYEISVETAKTLLGTDDFEPLREQERAMWAAVLQYTDHHIARENAGGHDA